MNVHHRYWKTSVAPVTPRLHKETRARFSGDTIGQCCLRDSSCRTGTPYGTFLRRFLTLVSSAFLRRGQKPLTLWVRGEHRRAMAPGSFSAPEHSKERRGFARVRQSHFTRIVTLLSNFGTRRQW